MKTVLITSAAVLALAAPAVAQSAQSFAIEHALENNEYALAAAMIADESNVVTATGQLAAASGVDGLSAEALIALNAAQADDDALAIRAALSGNEVISTQGSGAGFGQIANSLDIAADLTPAEFADAYLSEVAD